MVMINKEEKTAIIKKFPNAQITRTMRQDSKRGHYYCVEERAIMQYLREYRDRNVIEEHPPRADKRNDKKTTRNGKRGR